MSLGHQMAAGSPQGSRHVPAVIKGHRHFSYGAAALPESIIIPQFYDITATKRSNVRLNDQLIPKPSDINIAERTIRVPIPKEHPYQSHISRFAVFPTFRSPDDPDDGVRAACRRPLDPLVPASTPAVALLSKTKGGPYRHEVLEEPMSARKNAVAWPGQHGFLDHPRPVEGQGQAFYPRAPKTVLPNAALRAWDATLSERTANALRNLERAQWLTSYQLHFTGSGPANPLMMDDCHLKTIDRLTGKTPPHTAQLRERACPALVPPAPRDGRQARARQGRRDLESSYRSPDPPLAVPPDRPPDRPSALTPRPLGSPAGRYRTPGPDCGRGGVAPQGRSSSRTGPRPLRPHLGVVTAVSSPPATGSDLGPVGRTRPTADSARSLGPFSQRRASYTHETNSPEDDARISRCEDAPSSRRREDHTAGSNMLSLSRDWSESTNHKRAESETARSSTNHKRAESETAWSSKQGLDPDEVRRSLSTPCIWPRPPAPPSAPAPGRRPPALLQLQDSFSKTEVQKRLHSALQGPVPDLRDHRHAGRKNRFYGFNSYYFHN